MPRCLCGTSVLRARSGLRQLVAFAQFWCILNPLESALTRPLASVHYTGLAEKLSALESALTKNRGRGCYRRHSFFVSCNSTLFRKNTRGMGIHSSHFGTPLPGSVCGPQG